MSLFKSNKIVCNFGSFFILAFAFGASQGWAQETAQAPVGMVASTLGRAYILRSGEKIAAVKGMQVYPTDQIVTTEKSVMKVIFADGTNIVSMSNSRSGSPNVIVLPLTAVLTSRSGIGCNRQARDAAELISKRDSEQRELLTSESILGVSAGVAWNISPALALLGTGQTEFGTDDNLKKTYTQTFVLASLVWKYQQARYGGIE